VRLADDESRNRQDGPRGDVDLTATGVRRMLAQQIEYVRTSPDLDPNRKVTLLAQLAHVALRAIQLSDLDARLEAVETALKLRDHQPPKGER
jgi:hypothetical protein